MVMRGRLKPLFRQPSHRSSSVTKSGVLAAVVFAAVGVTACKEAIDVDVAVVAGVPRFILANDRGACANQVTVYIEASPSPIYVWSIATKARCTNLREVVYAENTVGFEVFDGPDPLISGQEYTVRVDAPDGDGLARFVAP